MKKTTGLAIKKTKRRPRMKIGYTDADESCQSGPLCGGAIKSGF